MKVAIVGYGNLGKSLERETHKDGRFELVAIYSRRRLNNPLCRPFDEVTKGNFDVALIALGSQNDLTNHVETLKNVNTVDCFDNHARIANHKQSFADSNALHVVATGWDPGILSLVRGILQPFGNTVATVWGEGVSQGHSNALRAVDGVLDAVAFTRPKDNFAQLIANGVTDGKLLHDRICHVACVHGDKQNALNKIVAMPHYFVGYNTQVNFCTTQQVRQLKANTRHRGQIVCNGNGFDFCATLNLQNNADFTAKVMLAYAAIVPQLQKDGYRGAVDVLDLPLRYLATPDVL